MVLRTREETQVSAETPRQEPDLYYAGMRGAGSRAPTDAETRVLQIVGYGGGAVGVASGLILIEFLRDAAWIAVSPAVGLIVNLICVFGLLAAIYFAGPALKSLRRNRVFVFRGRPSNVGVMDVNYKALLKKRSYPGEIVTMADRRTVLRIDRRYLPTCEAMREASRVAPARGPYTRQLTEEERTELREHIRRFRRPSPLSAFSLLTLVVLPGFCLLRPEEVPLKILLISIIPVCLSLGVLNRIFGWYRFAGQLKRDLADGVITEGNLWSGLPWLVNGEPAPWRIPRPVIGGLDVDVEKLKKL